jgi:NUMOD4 motif/NUMOD1 domain
MKQRKYPYQQLDLDDLPYERWDDIPFLDGLYRISNFGRIKRLDIEIVTKRGNTMRFKPKILSPCLQKEKNKGVNDFTHSLSGTICREGVIYKFSIARLVYYCFVKKFALDNYSLFVVTKDGDGRNIKLANLQLTDTYGKQKLIYERGRYITNITTIFDEYIKEGKIKSKNPYSKQVSQYTLKGKFIKTFPGIRVAAKITGARESGITSVLKKRQLSSGGHVWGYGTKKFIDVAAIRKQNLENRDILVGRKVTQYNLKGKRIACYYTIAEAARKTGVTQSDIHAVLKNDQRSAGGFIWKEGFGKSTIDVKGLLTGEAWRAFRLQKQVVQCDSKGKIISTFESVKAAAAYIGLVPVSISSAIKSGRQSRGFYWRFAKKNKNSRKF